MGKLLIYIGPDECRAIRHAGRALERVSRSRSGAAFRAQLGPLGKARLETARAGLASIRTTIVRMGRYERAGIK